MSEVDQLGATFVEHEYALIYLWISMIGLHKKTSKTRPCSRTNSRKKPDEKEAVSKNVEIICDRIILAITET